MKAVTLTSQQVRWTPEIAIMHKRMDGSANLVFTAQQTIESH